MIKKFRKTGIMNIIRKMWKKSQKEMENSK